MKNDNGKRIVAWNGHLADEVGVIWCTVVEDQAGYNPMTGRDPLTSPWYLAKCDDFRKEDGSVDYTSMWKRAEEVVDSWNEDHGHSRKDAMEVVASSMRLQFKEE